MREKNGYRDELANLRSVFGADTHSLSVEDVASYLRLDRRTVVRQIKRTRNPIPAINLGSERRPLYSISIIGFARWRCG